MSVAREGDLTIARAALQRAGMGFTWEDVDMLETLAREWHRDIVEGAHADEEYSNGQLARFRTIVDRIAALLPPRDDET